MDKPKVEDTYDYRYPKWSVKTRNLFHHWLEMQFTCPIGCDGCKTLRHIFYFAVIKKILPTQTISASYPFFCCDTVAPIMNNLDPETANRIVNESTYALDDTVRDERLKMIQEDFPTICIEDILSLPGGSLQNNEDYIISVALFLHYDADELYRTVSNLFVDINYYTRPNTSKLSQRRYPMQVLISFAIFCFFLNNLVKLSANLVDGFLSKTLNGNLLFLINEDSSVQVDNDFLYFLES